MARVRGEVATELLVAGLDKLAKAKKTTQATKPAQKPVESKVTDAQKRAALEGVKPAIERANKKRAQAKPVAKSAAKRLTPAEAYAYADGKHAAKPTKPRKSKTMAELAASWNAEHKG